MLSEAYSKSGYVVGLIGTVAFGLLNLYCTRTLVTVQYELCRRYKVPSMSYLQTAKHSFKQGPQFAKKLEFVGVLAQFFITLFQFGCCCVHIIFIANNLKSIQEDYSGIGKGSDIRLIMCLIYIILLLIGLVNSFKRLATFSFLGVISMLTGFCLMFFNFLPIAVSSFDSRIAFGSPASYPLLAASVIYSVSAIGAVLPLENEMADPKRFTSKFGVLNITMALVIPINGMVGFAGYLKYGENVKAPITGNLPRDSYEATLAKLLLTFSVFIAYEISLFLPYNFIWKVYILPHFENPLENLYFWQVSLRIVLITVTLMCSIAIPKISLFIPLLGSLCLASTGIALPAVCNLFTYWNNYAGKTFVLFVIWCLFIAFVGMSLCFIGAGICVIRILETIYNIKF
ncbi:proton-coupled amino acid transporter-like protein acs isoform X2 [Lycorma delicatula]